MEHVAKMIRTMALYSSKRLSVRPSVFIHLTTLEQTKLRHYFWTVMQDSSLRIPVRLKDVLKENYVNPGNDLWNF